MQLKTAGDLLPFLSTSFKKAVEELPDTASTPAQMSAFLRFFNTYGAYYTRQVTVGASLEFYVAVSTTSALSASEVKAAMAVHYHGLFTSGSINAEFQKTNVWQSYSQTSVIAMKVSGGDDALRSQLSAIDEKVPGEQTVLAFDKWKKSKGVLPIVTFFHLSPISQLCGAKAEVVGEAWGKIWPTLHPNMYIETTSDSASPHGPVVILSGTTGQIIPDNEKTSNCGCMVAVLNRNNLHTEFARYYCINPDNWSKTYTAMYARVYNDINDLGYNNQNYVLVFVTMGMPGAAIPPTNLYNLLLAAGAGKGLQTWRDTPKGYTNYVLVGVPTIGVGKGAECYAVEGMAPTTVRTGAYFYKDFSNLPYDVALNPTPLQALETTEQMASEETVSSN